MALSSAAAADVVQHWRELLAGWGCVLILQLQQFKRCLARVVVSFVQRKLSAIVD